MADEAEDIEIVLDDLPGDAPLDPPVEKSDPPPTKDAKPVEDLGESLAELKRRLEESESRAQAAEARARDAQNFASFAQNAAQDSDLNLVSLAIESIGQQNAALKAAYRDALSGGDFDAAAEAQAAMAANSAKLMQLEQGKQALEAKPKAQPVANVDPVEALAAQLTPRSAAWVRQHPEFAKDPNKYNKMLAAHNLAVADGIPIDSDDYFASVEETLKIRKAAPEPVDDPMAAAAQVTQRRTPPPPAPTSRQAATNGGSRQNVIRLSADEREMASNMGMTDKEYAINKMKLQKEGKLN